MDWAKEVPVIAMVTAAISKNGKHRHDARTKQQRRPLGTEEVALNTIEIVRQRVRRFSVTRNLLGKAEAAQNLDGNRLEGSLLRPLGQKLKSAWRAHQGGAPTYNSHRSIFWLAIARGQQWRGMISLRDLYMVNNIGRDQLGRSLSLWLHCLHRELLKLRLSRRGQLTGLPGSDVDNDPHGRAIVS
jgi:hypothetical protein